MPPPRTVALPRVSDPVRALQGATPTGAREVLRRDPRTWWGYLSQTAYAAVLYGTGPVTALVRREQGLGFLAASAFPALLSLGAAGGATLAGRLLRSGERAPVLVRPALLMLVVGVAGLGVPSVAVVGAAFFLCGAAGGFVIAAVAVLLEDLHRDVVRRALLEVNVIAAAGGVVQTALLGIAGSLASWRLALIPVGLACAGLAAWQPRATGSAIPPRRPPPRGAAPEAAGRLPRAARWYVAATMVGGALEFAVVLWAADLLVLTTGVAPAPAAGALTAFTGGLVVGRIAGSRLVGTPGSTRRLLLGSMAATAAGAVVLRAAPSLPGAIAALALTGLGVASLFPVGMALAVSAAGRATARASAAAVTGVSLSVLVAPVALAGLADTVGLRTAFVTVPVLGVLGIAVVLAGRRT